MQYGVLRWGGKSDRISAKLEALTRHLNAAIDINSLHYCLDKAVFPVAKCRHAGEE